jgi:hypothetical protein
MSVPLCHHLESLIKEGSNRMVFLSAANRAFLVGLSVCQL